MIAYHINLKFDLPEEMPKRITKASRWFAEEVLKDANPYTPWREGPLTQTARTERVSPNEVDIVYVQPYAPYVWDGVRMVNGATGKGPAYIPGVGYRYPRGAHLIPTGEPLHYNKDTHPLAQDHWIDAAAQVRMDHWKRGVEEILSNG